MIIELVGMPGTGKSRLADALEKQGAVLARMPKLPQLFFDSLLFWLSRPVLACKLLANILWRSPREIRYELFVNGYLGYAARYREARRLSRTGATVVLDQGFFQLIVSLGSLSPEVVHALPKSDLLVLVETSATLREERMALRGWTPREELGPEKRLAWQREAEASLRAAFSSIASNMRTLQYDGAQDRMQGAATLLSSVQNSEHRTPPASSVRMFFKTALAFISFAIALVARLCTREPQVVVLMYHSIDRSGWKLSVTPDVFERQMRYLARKGWAVPLGEVVSYAKGEKNISTRAVAVTFDDGYRDLLTTVLPILERYRIPASVFVPSDLSAQTDPNNLPRLTEQELRTLSQSSLITIGSHAESHRKFTELSYEDAVRESSGSADALRRMLGSRPKFFSYPFGARSGDAERAVKEAGYSAALGITEGLIHRGDNVYALKRVQVDTTMNALLFRARLTAALDWNRRIVDLFRGMMPI